MGSSEERALMKFKWFFCRDILGATLLFKNFAANRDQGSLWWLWATQGSLWRVCSGRVTLSCSEITLGECAVEALLWAIQGSLWGVWVWKSYFELLRDHFGECAVEALIWATQGSLWPVCCGRATLGYSRSLWWVCCGSPSLSYSSMVPLRWRGKTP